MCAAKSSPYWKSKELCPERSAGIASFSPISRACRGTLEPNCSSTSTPAVAEAPARARAEPLPARAHAPPPVASGAQPPALARVLAPALLALGRGRQGDRAAVRDDRARHRELRRVGRVARWLRRAGQARR